MRDRCSVPNMHEFQRQQEAFTRYIRSASEISPPPGIEPRRAALYRELLFANIQSCLANGFPVLRRILGSGRWHDLVRDFFENHRCETPLFAEIPGEFLGYLQSNSGAVVECPRFTFELAHYEWVELALAIAPDPDDGTCERVETAVELLPDTNCAIRLYPLAWPLLYAFPVHRISESYQPENPPPVPTSLLVYRDEKDSVQFVELNLLTHRLLQFIEGESARTFDDLVGFLRENRGDDGFASDAALTEALTDVLNAFIARRIICRDTPI